MLVPVLISAVIILGFIFIYLYYLSPRFNPLNRADIYLNQNLIDQAMAEYDKITEKDPFNPVAHYRLGLIYISLNQVDKGMDQLEQVVRINKYGNEVKKIDVERKLAETYIFFDRTAEAFQLFSDIIKMTPGDTKALYHVAFILLGQEYFELAQKYFDRLAMLDERNFEILFGAGIACYQNQKVNEAIDYFKEALSIDPHSDIANLAMAFAQQKKRDYKAALNYARMVIDTSPDESARFIAKRLFGILSVQAQKPSDGVKALEEALGYARKKSMNEEAALILYDLGFAALHTEMTELAYEYWNQLYLLNREFKKIQILTPMLRKEMDSKVGARADPKSVIEYSEEWLRDAFPENYIWSICGLKSARVIDLGPGLAAAGSESAHEDASDRKKLPSSIAADNLNALIRLDAENFRIIAGRVAVKLGYIIDEILPTYRESDGVDFLAHSQSSNEKALVWVRRWKDIQIGEIPFRNLAQAVNDAKADQGIFITASELTQASENALKGLPRVRVVSPAELGNLLVGLL
jgi:tetratricopeptide (TPR) repeat protein